MHPQDQRGLPAAEPALSAAILHSEGGPWDSVCPLARAPGVPASVWLTREKSKAISPKPHLHLPKTGGVQNTRHSSPAPPSRNPRDTYRREGHCSCDITTPPRPPQPLRVTPRPLWVGYGLLVSSRFRGSSQRHRQRTPATWQTYWAVWQALSPWPARQPPCPPFSFSSLHCVTHPHHS